MTSSTDAFRTSSGCFWATNPDCQSPVFFPAYDYSQINCLTSSYPYEIPGMVQGCYLIDSLLLSTLECLYSTCCLTVLHYYMSKKYSELDTGIPWFQPDLLVYEPTSSHFAPNTSFDSIVGQMMIEEPSLSPSFDHYYETCAPTHCSYSISKHKKNLAEILITLISTLSGLTVALRIITPLLVKSTLYLLQRKIKRERRGKYIY